MDIRYMREFISRKYSTDTIRGVKIKDMPDKQIMAIYFRIINSTNKPKKQNTNNNYHQMSLEEYEPPKKKEAIEIAFEKGYKDGPQIQITQLNLFDFMKETV